MPQIIANALVTELDMLDGAITENGRHIAYRSNEIATNNNKAIHSTLQIASINPSRVDSAGAIVSFLVERKDDAGNWHPFHSLLEPYFAIQSDPSENGGIIPDHVLSIGPNLENADTPYDATDGVNVTSRESQKRGVCPDKIRFVVVVHERKFGTLGAFQDITFSIDYELEAE